MEAKSITDSRDLWKRKERSATGMAQNKFLAIAKVDDYSDYLFKVLSHRSKP